MDTQSEESLTWWPIGMPTAGPLSMWDGWKVTICEASIITTSIRGKAHRLESQRLRRSLCA